MKRSIRNSMVVVAALGFVLSGCAGSSSDTQAPQPAVSSSDTQAPQPAVTTQRTPMGNEMPSAVDVEIVESMIAQVAAASEGSLIRALSGNWNEALGYYPDESGIAWMQEIALYLDDQVENEAGCYQIDTVMADVADTLQTDNGRAEYIVGAAMLAWSDPQTIRFVMLNCA
jgi:hypothetical protein